MGENTESNNKKRNISLGIGGAGLLLMAGSVIMDLVSGLIYENTYAYWVGDMVGSCSFCINGVGMVLLAVGLFFFLSDLFSKET